jgi:hypothetical protein
MEFLSIWKSNRSGKLASDEEKLIECHFLRDSLARSFMGDDFLQKANYLMSIIVEFAKEPQTPPFSLVHN